MELVLAFAAGLLTLLNPCVLPVVPIALASGLQQGRAGPVILAAGMGASFTAAGVAVSALGPALGISPESVSQAFAILMIAFGLVLLSPILSVRFAMVTAGVSNSATQQLSQIGTQSIGSQFLGGTLLGAIWVPCIGPTLGGAIALASQGAQLAWASAIMAAFSLGVGVLIVGIAYGLRGVLSDRLAVVSRWVKPVTGAAYVFIGFATLFGFTDIAAGLLLDLTPAWLQDFSVAI